MNEIPTGKNFLSPSRAKQGFRWWGRGLLTTSPFGKFVTSFTIWLGASSLTCRQPCASIIAMNDLSLGSSIRTRGRAAKPIVAAEVRELDEADLVLLDAEKGVKPPPIKKLAERHHALARALASGMSPSDAAVTCGYSLSRVSILQDDPAFKELLHFYRDDVDKQYSDLHSRLAGLSMDAASELGERLEADMQSEDKSISISQLMEITKLGADRTGHGPQSSSTNLNVNVDLADRLKQARERVAKRAVIEQK